MSSKIIVITLIFAGILFERLLGIPHGYPSRIDDYPIQLDGPGPQAAEVHNQMRGGSEMNSIDFPWPRQVLDGPGPQAAEVHNQQIMRGDSAKTKTNSNDYSQHPRIQSNNIVVSSCGSIGHLVQGVLTAALGPFYHLLNQLEIFVKCESTLTIVTIKNLGQIVFDIDLVKGMSLICYYNWNNYKINFSFRSFWYLSQTVQ